MRPLCTQLWALLVNSPQFRFSLPGNLPQCRAVAGGLRDADSLAPCSKILLVTLRHRTPCCGCAPDRLAVGEDKLGPEVSGHGCAELGTVSQDVKAETPNQVATFRCCHFENVFESVSPQKSLGSPVWKRKPALASWQKGPSPPGSAQSRPAACGRMGCCPPGLESRCELVSVWLLG